MEFALLGFIGLVQWQALGAPTERIRHDNSMPGYPVSCIANV